MPFKQTARIRTCALALAVAAALAVGSDRSAQAAQTNLAYDELTRFLGADQPTPVPGSFTTEFQAAVDAQKPATQHHGLFGAIQNMADSAKNALNMFKLGIPSRHAFMKGWERTDDLGAQTATIVKPDRHQIITLNLAKKTYRITDTSVQPPSETPPPYQPPSNPQAPQPSPQPGTGRLDITTSSSSLGQKTIENVSTTGYSQDFKMTATHSTGSCKDGSFGTSMVEYISNYPEPQLAPSGPKMHKPSMMPPMGAMMGVKPGCNPTTTTHQTGGVTPPSGRLSMWTFVTLKGNAQTNDGQVGGGFSTLIERGNVRTLGSADASLFEVPSDFTKEQ